MNFTYDSENEHEGSSQGLPDLEDDFLTDLEEEEGPVVLYQVSNRTLKFQNETAWDPHISKIIDEIRERRDQRNTDSIVQEITSKLNIKKTRDLRIRIGPQFPVFFPLDYYVAVRPSNACCYVPEKT